MREATCGDTVTTLFECATPSLAVACSRCSRRTLLTPRQLEAHEGDRRALLRLPLLCRCGSRDVALYVIETPDDVPAFLAGDTPQPYEGQGDANRWRPSF
jgi:DNA-directed RNA polymerase subunit RPC12/RpoP